MTAQVLGISGSPIANSNTDQAVRAVLAHTGLDTEFIKLSDLQIGVWMMEEGMQNLGSMIILGNVPCIRCGHGDQCEMSGIKMLSGPDATVASVGVWSFAAQPPLLQAARELGERIRAAVAPH